MKFQIKIDSKDYQEKTMLHQTWIINKKNNLMNKNKAPAHHLSGNWLLKEISISKHEASRQMVNLFKK